MEFKLAVKVDGEQRHLISHANESKAGKTSSISKMFDIGLKTGQNLEILVIESSDTYKNAGKYSLAKSKASSARLVLTGVFRSLHNI